MKTAAVILILFSIINIGKAQKKTITFPSKDGLEITADLYEKDKNATVILLCHQAGYSRGEYLEIAPKLNALGFTCMAIDQRSGNAVNNIVNQTAKKAKKQHLKNSYLASEPDIIAAIAFLSKKYNQKIILWGSSYSAALSLKIGKENENVKAVLSFSPGEYLKGVNLNKTISKLEKPVFVTSSQKEGAAVKKVLSGVATQFKTQFVPKVSGFHGSKALWKTKKGNESYWKEVKKFLKKVK